MKNNKVKSLVFVLMICACAAFTARMQPVQQTTGKMYAGLSYATGASGKEGLILGVWGAVHSSVSGAVYGAVFGGPVGFGVGLGIGL